MKQTAVEWLEYQISTSKYYYKIIAEINRKGTVAQPNVFEQAKQMEKQQKFYSEEDMRQIFEFGLMNQFNKFEVNNDNFDYFINLTNKKD